MVVAIMSLPIVSVATMVLAMSVAVEMGSVVVSVILIVTTCMHAYSYIYPVLRDENLKQPLRVKSTDVSFYRESNAETKNICSTEKCLLSTFFP